VDGGRPPPLACGFHWFSTPAPNVARRGASASRCKVCKSCMLVKYCNAECQKNHWPKHKTACKLSTSNGDRDEALFKDPPAKEDCPDMLFTNADNYFVCVTSTRDNIDRTNLRFYEST
jgi:hypothetical protein